VTQGAHWQRGYRRHGLWDAAAKVRLGTVGLGPAGWHDGAYRWSATGPDGRERSGEETSLKAAKRKVEAVVGGTGAKNGFMEDQSCA
jgi:hypothetical protein